jgi:Na+/proline symporter/nitrogen-specific signal transduction histidine kinase
MSFWYVVAFSFSYIYILFLIAYFADKDENRASPWVNNSVVYSLSMAVYCTAWTFYGSVGRAATTGAGFLPVYLGAVLAAPLFPIVLRKILLISKTQRITSIADFIASRYGKSPFLGILVTIIAVVGIIPYISLQLKAIDFSFAIITSGHESYNRNLGNASTAIFSTDTAYFIAILLAVFTVMFGTRHIEPNERHSGLVAAVAFESLVKLVAFIALGVYVCFGLHDGFTDIFSNIKNNIDIQRIFSVEKAGVSNGSWFILTILSALSILCLPRQFHIAVVENENPNHVFRAMWMFPLYLLLINFFVLPVAVAGLTEFRDIRIDVDTLVLDIPMAHGASFLALMVFLGGLSAATSMVIVETNALSIMISNHIVMPLLLRVRRVREDKSLELLGSLLIIRRIMIFFILFLAYLYYKMVGTRFTLVSIGLISFTAVAQFAPAIIGGIFWKRATKAGTIIGLIAGFLIWAYCLPLASLSELRLISPSFIEKGLLGISFLKPYQLFGLEGFDPISNAALWSLSINILCYVVVSLHTNHSKIELTQADLFVDIEKYIEAGNDFEVVKRRAKLSDIRNLLNRFLGEDRSNILLRQYENDRNISLMRISIADADLVGFAETHIAGAIGAPSAKTLISSIVKEDPVSFEEILSILEQTQEILQYSRALEKKSTELEATTIQLKTANDQLKELDRLKAEFITTVTHELRTPITSIKSLSKILLDNNKKLDETRREKFLGIVVDECNRIARLINQVLDLEKIQSQRVEWQAEPLVLNDVVKQSFDSVSLMLPEKKIDYQFITSNNKINITGDKDKLTQVMVNLLSNAIKFCAPQSGVVNVTLTQHTEYVARIYVQDNGIGILSEHKHLIFEKFTQLSNNEFGKPHGSGLGLFITKTIIEHHGGKIWVESQPNMGATFIVELPIA